MRELTFGRKVAILVPNLTNSSGDARVAEEQARILVRQGNKVTIFAITSDRRILNAETFINIPLSFTLQRVYRLVFPFDFVRILKVLRMLRSFEVVIAHLYPMTFLACLCKIMYKSNYIFWFHGIEDPWVFPELYQKVYILLQRYLTKVTILNADRIVSVSKFAQRMLLRHLHLQSEVVYNEIDLNRFHKELEKAEVRSKYGLSDEPLVLFVGRLAPQKGAHLLIKAFKLVRESIPEARLMLVGQEAFPKYVKDLKSLADDSVIFIGSVPYEQMPYYYAMCDVYMTCSLWEMCPLPVLEAQACGKPVIAFDIPPMREIKSRNPEMDLTLVKAGDISASAVACVKKIRGIRGIP